MGFIEPYAPPRATNRQFVPYTGERRFELNRKHRDNPEPGDYWHEMFVPSFVVLAVWGSVVIYCDRVALYEGGGAYIDPERIVSSTKEEFARRISYDTIPENTWGDVVPGALWRSARRALGLDVPEELG